MDMVMCVYVCNIVVLWLKEQEAALSQRERAMLVEILSAAGQLYKNHIWKYFH